MANDYPRSYRVADHIQRELAGIIRLQVKDPRISEMLTIAAVEVSRDLSVARVYYSLLDSAEQKQTQQGLERSAGFLRKKLSDVLSMRAVPALRFYYDDSVERGNEMSALIDAAVQSNTTAAESGAESGADSDDAAMPKTKQNDLPPEGSDDGHSTNP